MSSITNLLLIAIIISLIVTIFQLHLIYKRISKIAEDNDFKNTIGFVRQPKESKEPKRVELTRIEIMKDLYLKNTPFNSSDSDEELRNKYNQTNKGKVLCTKILKQEPDNLGILHIV